MAHTWAASLPHCLGYSKASFLALRQQIAGAASGTVTLSGPLIRQFSALFKATRGDLLVVPATISIETLNEFLSAFDSAKASPFEAPAPWLSAPKFGISTTRRSKAFTILGYAFPKIGLMKPLRTQAGVEVKQPLDMVRELQNNRFGA